MATKWSAGANAYIDTDTGKVVSSTPQYSNGEFQKTISSSGSSTSTKTGSTSSSSSGSRSSAVVNAWNTIASGLDAIKKNGSTNINNAPKIENVLGTSTNTKGSGKDANAVQTQAGSLATLNNNTQNSQLSPMQTTVTQGVGNIDPYTAWINQYNEHVAQNNLAGQIDDLTELNRMGLKSINGRKIPELLAELQGSSQTTGANGYLTGKTSEVAGTTTAAESSVDQPWWERPDVVAATEYLNANIKSRDNKKVNPPIATEEQEQQLQTTMENTKKRTISNYLDKINKANSIGDYETADQLKEELEEYYTVNGISPTTNNPISTQTLTPDQYYQTQLDQLEAKYDNAYKELEANYERMYGAVLNDVTNGIISQLGNLMNFEYDPYKDRALHIAQGYAKASVKETMNATGMYYSSMTQNAITKAVAELVPVYEKMAKEEIQTNLQMLQNVGNYLMNLETQQFNMWKAQMQLKVEAIEQRRKDVTQAIERAEMLGYIDNQASAILGIEAGTPTYQAKKDAQDRQDKIDAEIRGYEQEEAMTRLADELQRGRMQEQSKIDIEKIREQYRLQEENASKSDWRNYEIDSKLQQEKYDREEEIERIKAKKTNNAGGSNYTYGTMKASDMEENYYNLIDKGYSSDEAIDYLLNYGKDDSEKTTFLTSIGEDPKKWLGETPQQNPGAGATPESYGLSGLTTGELKKEYGEIGEDARNLITSKDVLEKLKAFYGDSTKTLKDFKDMIDEMKTESSEAGDVNMVVYDLISGNSKHGFNKVLKDLTDKFSDNYSSTSKAMTASLAAIDDYMELLEDLGYDKETRADYGEYMYERLADKISGSKDMDMTWLNFNDKTADSKDRAVKQLIEHMEASEDEAVVKFKGQVQQYARNLVPVYVPEGTNKKETSTLTKQDQKAIEQAKNEQNKIYANNEVQQKMKQITQKVKEGKEMTKEELQYVNEQMKSYPYADKDGRIYKVMQAGKSAASEYLYNKGIRVTP